MLCCAFWVWNIHSCTAQIPQMLCSLYLSQQQPLPLRYCKSPLSAWRSTRVGWVWVCCLQVIEVQYKHKVFFFLLTRVLTKLKLMAWLNTPLAMTTFSLFSPSVMLFGRERTAGRLSLLVLMLSFCHAHCMSKSLPNFPLFFCQTSLWFLLGRKWSSTPCAAVCVTLPKSGKNTLGRFENITVLLNVHSPMGNIWYAAPKLKLQYFYSLVCDFMHNIYPWWCYMED